MTTQKNNVSKSLNDLFSSLKLTMFLLIMLAIVSIIGTVIPQGNIPEEYIARITPNKLALYKTLGFFDMYHSWWFVLLLSLLNINLIACSWKRLPHIWNIITRPVVTLDSSLEKSMTNRETLSTSIEPEVLKSQLVTFLKNNFATPAVTEVDGTWHLFAQKAPWCRLSVYFVHLSVIIIFIGAIIGSLFGYKGNVNILEGESISSVMSRTGKEIALNFSLRCEQFSVAKYPNGAPKEFKSILTVLENGKPVPDYTNVRVIVNDPLTYKGITFYQSSYGNAGNYYFTVSDLDGKNTKKMTVAGQSSEMLPDGSSIHVLESTDDVSQFAQGVSGPAVQVELHDPAGKTERFIVYANHPDLSLKHAQEHGKGPVLLYNGEEKKIFTGLQVAKDPGVEVVWFGCFLMVIGIYAAFFLSHRRVWIRIQENSVTIGGNSSKNQSSFQNSFEGLVECLKDELSREKRS